MNPPPSRQAAQRLTALCCLIYFASYLTRLNYGAALTEIIRDFQVSKETAILAVTGSFITYGAGQLFSGALGDRFSPRLIITLGMIATCLCNMAVALLDSMAVITVLWCCNGFFQSMLWPPLVKIMVRNLSKEDYARGCVLVSGAATVGTIAVYLLVPLCIQLNSWRLSFHSAALFGLLSAAAWLWGTRDLSQPPVFPDASPLSSKPAQTDLGRLFLLSGLVPVLAAIIAQGTLRDGLTTWMPTFIAENYQLGSSLSILTAVVLPVFSLVCIFLSSRLQSRVQNELFSSTLLFALGSAASVLLPLLHRSGAAASVLLMSVTTGCMYGVNMLLIGRLPAYFAPYGCVSTMSGILNACTYVGSALSTYGIAAVSSRFGWPVTMVLWAVIALAGTLLCAFSTRRWGNFTRMSEEELEKTQKITPSR